MRSASINLEAEYNNRARVPEHPTHIAGWKKDAATYRQNAYCELDIAYGDGERHLIDYFRPANGNDDGPVVLFIHGGYWQSLDKSYFSHLAHGPNERGFSVAIPNYDLAPTASLSQIIACIENAANFVMRRTGRALVATGHSAGGHLSACLMAKSEALVKPIRAAMPISGLFELAPLVPTSINKALGLSVEEAQRLSPLDWTPPAGGHLAAIVGGAESSEFLRQSRLIADQWSHAGVATHYYEVPGAHHFDVIAGLADPADPLVEILSRLATHA
jgi:acetyl esterase/lipase